ncbi:putative OB-fold protein [Acidovorax sp. 93]|jgi:uncharacterized OB-fold protein|uniref:Zn-ribbon domain-containing OB-fold protein n=1 Tax=Acidovorax sp. 93 TaxID=2135632 RepID=UPI000769B77D|nr:Zn-ribbon domain-containing OB-fold protein [Acidovorax sp. 93]RKR26118.1 putative OB-fold protein [Acidovorax sp. 93]
MPRKLPQITSDSSAFWQGGESGRLMIHRCSTCRRFFHPPAPICPFCGSLDVAPQATSGRGRIATYTINHQAWKPELATPYVVAIVELDDQPGLRLLSNVVELVPDQVRIGMPVHVTFEQHEDVWLPLFKKAE